LSANGVANSASLPLKASSAKNFCREARDKALNAKDLSCEARNKGPLGANNEATLTSFEGKLCTAKLSSALRAKLRH